MSALPICPAGRQGRTPDDAARVISSHRGSFLGPRASGLHVEQEPSERSATQLTGLLAMVGVVTEAPDKLSGIRRDPQVSVSGGSHSSQPSP